MTNELAVSYEVDGTDITLNPGIVLRYMIDPKEEVSISNKEMGKIIMTCKARNLNPFTGDVVVQHFTGRDGRTTCSLIMTKDFFIRRADSNPRYKGMKSGVMVYNQNTGRLTKREGSAVYKSLGEQLLGGWAEVYTEGREPFFVSVSFDEYNTGKSIWNSKPATMICKVAQSQALRAAFPNEFNGLYEPEEMGLDEAELNPVEVVPDSIENVSVTEEIPMYEPAGEFDMQEAEAILQEGMEVF